MSTDSGRNCALCQKGDNLHLRNERPSSLVPHPSSMVPHPSSLIILAVFVISALVMSCQKSTSTRESSAGFQIIQDDSAGTLSIFRIGGDEPILVQNAANGMRPYLHPIMTPDGKGSLTEYSPGHHKHQTGLYWGFTRVNGTGAPVDTVNKWFYNRNKPPQIKEQLGRDFFHFNGASHWKRVSATTIISEGEEVKWQTVYHMLDGEGAPIMEETQNWSLTEQDHKFLISIEWNGKAFTDITINEHSYGGMFLLMPWREDIVGEVVNAARQRNQMAEGQQAMWVDVGMELKGRDDWGHIAIFDHPQNAGFPTPWRVDNQLGIGPARAMAGDWQIKKGFTEIIKHQIVAYTGELDDIGMRKLWDEYIGSSSMYSVVSLWKIAQEEGKLAKFLSPQEAVEAMTVKEGYNVNVWASEPMITQPMAFCWDDKGRLWVAENRDYENRGTGFSNDGHSRILILEDIDKDGIADSKKVFLEGIPFPAAIAVGFDGLYLGAPPNLLFVPDLNHDDQADMENIEVLLTGWGIRDRHETLNSLLWGPDGWLYGLEGFATPSKIHPPKGKGKLYVHKEPFPNVLDGEGVDINGGVWRFHPQKKRFEVVAHGFSNPWGIDYDAKGQMFITACVIPHMFHVIPGGIYHRQGGQHFNPYVYKDIRTIVDHSHRSAHGGARIYQSDAFPQDQKGRLFMANIHEHAILSDVLEPQGSGFVAKHGDDFIMANNAQWIGFSMEIGPAGDLFVLDWHDADICGNSVMHKETGRIFRVSPQNSLAKNWEGRYADLAELTDEALAKLQLNESNWHARRARLILQARAAKGEVSAESTRILIEIFKTSGNADFRLRALWALHVTGAIKEQRLLSLLSHDDPYVRAWSVQFLCEDLNPSIAAINKFIQMATDDSSPVVRLYLAAALQRVADTNRWDIVKGLISHCEDADDHNIPKMIWFGLEPMVAGNPKRALKLAMESNIPLVTRFIARRVVDANALEILVEMAGNKSLNQVDLLAGLLEGLEGRTDLKQPPNWKAVYKELSLNKTTADLALAIAQEFGDSEAAKQFLINLMDEDADLEMRRTALKGLANKQRPELQKELPELWSVPGLSIEAIRAVAAYDNKALGAALLEKYPEFNTDEKLEVVQTMASRSIYGNQITKSLQQGSIQKSDIPAYVARQLRRVVGNGFVETWGPIDELSIDREKEYVRYKALANASAMQSADLALGKAVFIKSCGACHQMYGEGGSLGPDLTGSNRDNLDYILSNILDPNGDIQDDYKMVIITTTDGRTYAGNISGETDRQVTLRVVGQDQVIINTSNIQSREVAPKSMMPEGLLQTLTDKEVVDLFAYLQSKGPLP